MEDRYKRVVDLVELTGLLQTTTSGLAIDEIADRFEVSRRTAERMLAALRQRFPELEPERREGRKYWRLPREASPRSLRLPAELTRLSDRIEELEAMAVLQAEQEDQLHRGIEDAMSSSAVATLVLDAELRIIWTNHALETYFGLDRSDVLQRDARHLVRKSLRKRVAHPDVFEARLLGTYDDRLRVDNFECHVLAEGRRKDRWLEHWSQPIANGPHRGGRIEHYLDVTHRERRPELTLGQAALVGADDLRQPLIALHRSLDVALARQSEAAIDEVTAIAGDIEQLLARIRALRPGEERPEHRASL